MRAYVQDRIFFLCVYVCVLVERTAGIYVGERERERDDDDDTLLLKDKDLIAKQFTNLSLITYRHSVSIWTQEKRVTITVKI